MKKYAALSETNKNAYTLPGRKKSQDQGRHEAASLTAEAAFVIPLAFFALYAFMYLFLLIHTEFIVYQAIYAATDRLYYLGSVAAYAENSTFTTDFYEAAKGDVPEYVENLSSDLVSFLNGRLSSFYVEAMVRDYFSENEPGCVKNGRKGLDCSRSKVFGGNPDMHVEVEYTFSFPVHMFGLGEKTIVQSADYSAFYGKDWRITAEFDDDKKREEDGNPPEKYVYVTEYGEVYHRDADCSYINIKIEEVDFDDIRELRNYNGGKYYACSECARAAVSGKVYITYYGTRYHVRKNCSQIERIPEKIGITEAENRGYRPCSKCGEQRE